MRIGARACAVVCLAAIGTACSERGAAPPESIRDSGDVAWSGPALETVVAQPVHGRTGPGGQPFEVASRAAQHTSHLQRRIGTEAFDIALRATGLTQYPCTSCHSPGAAPSRSPQRIADAHQNIQPVHPAATGATCTTCHLGGDMMHLVLQSGERVTLDQAYRVCAQCHFPQADAWAGGAHGKRLEGWRGRRVVMGCTDCHDPHRPVIEKRIPFRAPRIPRTARGGS